MAGAQSKPASTTVNMSLHKLPKLPAKYQYSIDQIREYKRKQREERAKVDQLNKELAVQMTKDQYKTFYANLNFFWMTFGPAIFYYHLIVKEQHAKIFQMYIVMKRKWIILPYNCQCSATTASAHRHYIVQAPQEIKHIIQHFSKRNVPTFNKQRKYYMRKIKTRVHLVHTITYIQTVRVAGFSNGSLKCSIHFGHQITDPLFMNPASRRLCLEAWGNPEFIEEKNIEYECMMIFKDNKKE